MVSMYSMAQRDSEAGLLGQIFQLMNHHVSLYMYVSKCVRCCVSAFIKRGFLHQSDISLISDQAGDTDVISLHLPNTDSKVSTDGKQNVEGESFVVRIKERL